MSGPGEQGLVRASIQVSGRVQGVYFRARTAAEARRLGLAGWVRNLASGDVAVVAEGPDERVAALEDWCHRGPPMARVDTVSSERGPASGEFDGFHVRS